MGLGRGRNDVSQGRLEELIRGQLDGAGCLVGYRSVWHSLRLVHSISVSRNRVANLMKEIDPVGVELRKRRRLRGRESVLLTWS